MQEQDLFLFYVGFDTKIPKVEHHNLFFDTNFDEHAQDIYDKPKWPSDPLFYANFTSKTFSKTAPNGYENGFFLIPIATNLKDTNEIRDLDVIYPSIGENLSFLKSIKKKKNLNYNFIVRDGDEFCWQFSNKGYFNFKSNIPKIIQKIT